MVLERVVDLLHETQPLVLRELPVPEPGPGEILLRVATCGVCHTELDEIEGRTPPPRFPVIPGHQVIGRVVACGDGVAGIETGSRRGVAWIYSSCGHCDLCRSGNENLCAEFSATGRDADGGYAEYMVAPAAFTYSIPDVFSDAEAAPLLCGGAIGYRSLMLANLKDGQILGLTGFGASGHQVLKLARYLYPKSPVFVFARSEKDCDFARSLGADWAGGTTDNSPSPCDSIIDTTPAWLPVLSALERLRPGGRLVINAIRKESHDSELLAGISYERHLWMEKEIKSVANITRADVSAFLDIAARMGLKPEVRSYPLEEANRVLLDLRHGKARGAAVLIP
ncbi:MAG TPA: zinc-binding alcohol dehydrogenase family protein [Chlorobaculum sp.]|uniref:Alcohol dehydrogenase, zinc-containing n=2 Tax=Chlorobaculum tepidum TaxID=1097 RepID=Q8KCY2_CHLTE|nr:alcohol dehydrogenase, zinc-containing [Chlorobaculum tepidum TLS]HBU23586.1 zinc-binding alcohol dehydrogenase family protein [Chlorobaculum sp.]